MRGVSLRGRLPALALAILLAAAGSRLGAQTQTAQISGIVTDTTGAVLDGAVVKLTRIDTGIVRQGLTNGTGAYAFPGLTPGRYRLEIAKPSFQAATIPELALSVNQSTNVPIQLRVGDVSQTVEVRAEGAALDATTAQLGTLVTQTAIHDLPLNARNFTQLLTLSPGASPVNTSQNNGGAQVQKVGAIVFPAVNGQSNRNNTFTLDGVYNNGAFMNTYAIAPSVDALSEFKLDSHGDQAKFGGVTGGVVNIVTKSGTNAFHGSAYEFLRNDALDARGFFAARKPPLRQNQFGGTVGGPIRKDQTFFFFSYEGYRQKNASSALYLVPTTAQLSGDFSASTRQIYDPFTTRADANNPGSYIRDPFAGNRIPSAQLNQAALDWAKAVFPAPIETGNPAFNGRNDTPGTAPSNQDSIRVDHLLTPRDFLWARYTWATQEQVSGYLFAGKTLTTSTPAKNLGANWTHTFGANALWSNSFGFAGLEANDVRFLSSTNLISKFQGLPQYPNQNVPGVTIPSIAAADVRNRKLGPMRGFQGRSDYSLTTGRHSLSFGGEVVHQPWFNRQSWSLFSFNSLQTSDPARTGSTGIDLASFLLGVPDSTNLTDTDLAVTSRVWGGYIQDSWKATPKLTFNFGLRWDLVEAPAVTRKVPGTWDFNTGKYLVGGVVPPVCSSTRGAPCLVDPTNSYISNYVVFTGSNQIRSNNYKMFGPRLGVAYRLQARTVLRAAYGIFYDTLAGVNQQAQNTAGNWPGNSAQQALNLNRTTVTVLLNNPFNGQNPATPALTPATQSGYLIDPRFREPYSQQWNAEVQHEFTDAATVSAAYVGSHTLRLPVGGSYNTALTPGPGAIAPRALFPYAPVTGYDRSIGQSNYHSLQVKGERRFAQGLAFLLAYTWSKSIDIASSGQFGVESFSLQNPYTPRESRSVSGFDVPHVFSAAASYALPFGPGQRWVKDGLASRVVGNWQVNALAQVRNGQPYTVVMNVDTGNVGTATARPNLVGDPALSNPTPAQWFNRAAFAAPATYTFGNSGRNNLRTDGLVNADFSLLREDRIRDQIRTQFRLEAFNAFNHPTFSGPGTAYGTAAFGVVSSTVSTARQVQLGFKVLF